MCGTFCAKSFLVAVNLTFVVLGWLLMGSGAWMHVFPESFLYGPLLLDNPTRPVVVLERIAVAFIVVGVIVFIIGFLGSCGTCTESVCFLGFYSTLVIISIGIQVVVVILASSFRAQILSSLEHSFFYQIRYQYNSTAQYTNDTLALEYRLTVAWEQLQSKLSCCGSRGPRDYKYSSWHNHSSHDLFVPQSCCQKPHSDNTISQGKDYLCQFDAVDVFNDVISSSVQSLNTKGCSTAVGDWLVAYMPVITIVVLLDALQVVCMFCACCLMKEIRQKLSEYSWCEEDEDLS